VGRTGCLGGEGDMVYCGDGDGDGMGWDGMEHWDGMARGGWRSGQTISPLPFFRFEIFCSFNKIFARWK